MASTPSAPPSALSRRSNKYRVLKDRVKFELEVEPEVAHATYLSDRLAYRSVLGFVSLTAWHDNAMSIFNIAPRKFCWMARLRAGG
jgi:hypothetical protein